MPRSFRADPDYFDLVFVANATAAIKMVAEGLRDHGFWYGYHADAHTSLVGVRELASAGSRCFFSDEEVDAWLAQGASFHSEEKSKAEVTKTGLFAYPAQSNMNGRRLPLNWPGRLRESRMEAEGDLYTLLDAAAYVGTAQLDLTDHANAPDFTALSFYKIFGFPDLGALTIRKEAGHVLLQRSYFGGDAWKATKLGALHEALEDGTPAFYSIAALHCALKVHHKLYGSMDNVSQHTSFLAAALYDQMSSLTHLNGRRLCTIYKGKTADYNDRKTQAPTIAFNIRDDQGQWIGKSYFERLATTNGIQLRTGGVCNPGGIAFYLAMSPGQMRENYAEGLRCGNGIDEMNGKPTGIIRVSLGSMSNSTDVETFMKFLRTFVEQETSRSPISKSQDNSEKSDWSERDVAAPMKQPSKKGVGIDDPIVTARKPTLDKMLHTLRRFTCH